jgi:hypothetical protein
MSKNFENPRIDYAAFVRRYMTEHDVPDGTFDGKIVDAINNFYDVDEMDGYDRESLRVAVSEYSDNDISSV